MPLSPDKSSFAREFTWAGYAESGVTPIRRTDHDNHDGDMAEAIDWLAGAIVDVQAGVIIAGTQTPALFQDAASAGFIGATGATAYSHRTIAQTKSDLSIDDLIALSGVTDGAADLGTFTGATISDNTDIATALQELETKAETAASTTTAGITEHATDAEAAAFSASDKALVPSNLADSAFLAAFGDALIAQIDGGNAQSIADSIEADSTAIQSISAGINATSAALDDFVGAGNLLLDEDDMSSDSATRGTTQQAAKAYVDAAITAIPSGVPAGSIAWFAANSPPSNWLECDGSAVSRSTYSGLFSAIGTTFGVGDGSTTFNLPDLRGEFIRGWDNSKGTDTGRSFGSAQTDEFEAHTHNVSTRAGAASTGGVARTDATADPINFATSSAGGASETRPRNIALMAIIKT